MFVSFKFILSSYSTKDIYSLRRWGTPIEEATRANVSVNNETDEELLQLVCNQDSRTAYEELYKRFYGNLLRLAYHKTGDLATAEDIVQDILLQVWKRRERIVLKERLAGYLTKAVKYKVLDVIAKKKNKDIYLSNMEDELTGIISNTDYAARESLFKEYISEELNKLPPRMRETFLLSREEGLNHEEIAAQLGISIHTVSTHITKAISILKKKLLVNSFLVIIS
ncbi:RNA polymerase sigma factor [Sphingobacterium yanglingense]|uniref:RNA polymerase sigma-70 factor (ECF subfamily) n=1 Tax=Sphingobacterium yanglingense TaxID=1437280 RepID=A0A4R6W4D8_9SPHI|nr:RNA polymerase sigma-70 factor [Sphingobacterium yanglingense]TDQ73448.1 RNA polymerase sigma-70 factor (ECF subfamily) [Sphingobacterium yanglingense]